MNPLRTIRDLLLLSVPALLLAPQSVAQSVPEASAGAITAADVSEWGHRRRIGDVEVLFLRGSPEQRGIAEGYLCAEEIVATFRDMLGSDLMPVPAGLWSIAVLPRVAQRVDFPERYRERCAGILRGVEARDPSLLEIPELRRDLVVGDLLAVATIPDAMGLACSSFAAWGELSEGEGPVVGRNLDYRCTPKMLEETLLKVHARDGDRAAWVAVGWPGVVGLLTGVSERGVTVAIHDVYVRGEVDAFTPRPIVLQEICERLQPGADAADMATRIARGFDLGVGGNAMVAWRGPQRGAVVLELNPKAAEQQGVMPRLPPEGRTWLACTNHYRSPAARVDLDGPPRCERYRKVAELLGGDAPPALDYARGWAAIGRPEVSITLYQAVTDLGAMQFGARLRRAPAQDTWDRVDDLDLRALCREATRGPERAAADTDDDGGR